jgi:peptidoglycan/LPS O-acetylase OafA/YrhL
VVIIGHCRDISGFSYMFLNSIDTHIAVCGFFIISGFLITRSCLYSASLKDYFLKRAKRLLPAYVFVVIFTACSLSLFSSLSISEYFLSFGLYKYVVSNLFFMNFLCPSLPGVFNDEVVNGSLWTIKIEVSFYIIVPFIVFILKKIKTRKMQNVFICAIYMNAIIYRVICIYWKNHSASHFVYFIAQLEHQLPGFMQYFSFGIFALFNYDSIRKYEKYLVIPALIFFGLHYVTKTEFFMPISLGLLIMFVTFNSTRLNRIGKEIDFSYGIYLFHFPIIQVLVFTGIFACNKYVGILLVLGSVFSLAYMSWQFLERKYLGR